MTVFGDSDPEDGWVPSDPLPERLDRLERWTESVVLEHAGDGPTPRARSRAGDAFDEVARHLRLRGLSTADVVRLAQLAVVLGPLPK